MLTLTARRPNTAAVDVDLLIRAANQLRDNARQFLREMRPAAAHRAAQDEGLLRRHAIAAAVAGVHGRRLPGNHHAVMTYARAVLAR
jgi:hypothetical protein